MYGQFKVAVVIPAHNEDRLLPQTLATLPAWIDDIIVVDDGSDDHTAQHASGPRVELISHTRNQGVGAAIRTGYVRACELGADIAVVVGADKQMDPTEMLRLVEPIAQDVCDYAKGNRMGHAQVIKRMPWVRYVGNRCLTMLTRWATGYGQLHDAQCGYTAISTSMLRQLPLDALYPRYGFPNDLLAKLANANARVMDRPVSPIYGEERSDLRISRVVLPILGILLRAARERLSRWRRRRRQVTLGGRAREAS